MSGHSPEPWKYSIDVDGRVNIFVDDGRVVTLCHARLRPEDARRIVACVNACAGIATEMLETMATDPLGGEKYWVRALAEVSEKRDRLNTENAALNDYCATVERQRDRLLAAARVTVEAFDSLPPTSETRMVPLCINGLRDSIASAGVQP